MPPLAPNGRFATAMGLTLLAGLAILIAFAAWVMLQSVIALCLAYPLMACFGGIAGGYAVWRSLELGKLEAQLRESRLRRTANERTGQDIGDFARDFPRRSVDTWVIRATYEKMRSLPGLASFPVRACDRLDLLLPHPEELDGILDVLAKRSGRILSGSGTIDTVGQLVQVVSTQPLDAVASLRWRPLLSV
jgi:hypothetical protein